MRVSAVFAVWFCSAITLLLRNFVDNLVGVTYRLLRLGISNGAVGRVDAKRRPETPLISGAAGVAWGGFRRRFLMQET
jgi:hypothetical protein